MSIDISVLREHFLAALSAGDLEQQIQYVQNNFSDQSEIREQLLGMLRDHQDLEDQTSAESEDLNTGSFGFISEKSNGFRTPVVERFEIGKKIGEGGFGEVYIADQTEPLCRTIALKVVKPGMGSKEVLSRFEIERQILALMDHPCIAKVFDAGVTDAGNPFFAMELVAGKRITDFCNQKKLDIKQRLDLFLSLCDAIEHAHQKGVIHRDIKPSNVLCLIQDEHPTLKVIDFGIAKALNPTINGHSFWTAKLQLVGTPLYMAPEQAAPPESDSVVDTRADIYSMGVLLYELLVGVTPIDRDSIEDRDIYWIREAIRQTEPLRPSVRLFSFDTSKRNDVCSERNIELRALNHWLRGDLDWIVMKAIEKEPDRRYATARELKNDLENFLNQKPVIAGPPTSTYRLRKFIQRNRLTIAAVAVIMISMLSGLSLAIWQASVAKQDRDRALLAERISKFRLYLFEDAQADKMKALAKAQKGAVIERTLRIEAETRERFAMQLIYTSDMRTANEALNAGDVSECYAILNRYIPTEDGPDIRGFEWHFLNNRCLKKYRRLQKGFSSFCFSRFMPGGKYLVTGTQNGTISLFDAKTESLIRELPGHLGMVNFVDLSPDGTMLASAGDDGMIRLWEISTGRQVAGFRGSEDYVHRVFFVLDGKTLISSDDGGEIRIWDLDTRKQIGQMGTFSNEKHMGIRNRLALSPDRLRCVAGDGFWTAYVFDLKTRKMVRKLDFLSIGGADSVRLAITFSADNKMVAAAHGDERITVWDADTGKVMHSFRGHRDDIQGLVFHPSSELLASCDRAGIIRFWPLTGSDQASSQDVQIEWPEFIVGHQDRIWKIDFDSSGKRLITAGRDGFVKIWSAVAPDEHSINNADTDVCIKWMNNKELLVSNSDLPIFWDPSQRTTTVLDNLPSSISRNAVSPDGTSFATGHRSGSVRLWNSNERKVIREWKTNAGAISGLRFTNDGKAIVAGGETPDIYVWNIESGETIAEFSVDKECESIAISPNDQLVAIASQNEISVHPLRDPGAVIRLVGHKNTAEAVEFDPGGNYLVSVSDDRTIRIWNTADWTEKKLILAHKHDIVSVAISPDGRTVASGDEMGNLFFSNPETGRPFYEVNMLRYWPKESEMRPANFFDMQFSPDGTRLAAAASHRGFIILNGQHANPIQAK